MVQEFMKSLVAIKDCNVLKNIDLPLTFKSFLILVLQNTE